MNVAGISDPPKLVMKFLSVSANADVNHLVAKKRFQLFRRTRFEQTADPDQLPAGIADPPRADQPIREFTPELGQRSSPMLPVQPGKLILKIEIPAREQCSKKIELLHDRYSTTKCSLFGSGRRPACRRAGTEAGASIFKAFVWKR